MFHKYVHLEVSEVKSVQRYRTSGRHTPRMFLCLAFAEVVIKCSVDSNYLSFLDCEKDGTRDFQVWVSRLLRLGRRNVSSSGNINVRYVNRLHYSTLHTALGNQPTVWLVSQFIVTNDNIFLMIHHSSLRNFIWNLALWNSHGLTTVGCAMAEHHEHTGCASDPLQMPKRRDLSPKTSRYISTQLHPSLNSKSNPIGWIANLEKSYRPNSKLFKFLLHNWLKYARSVCLWLIYAISVQFTVIYGTTDGSFPTENLWVQSCQV
jgi:hypothetical protein